MDFQKRLPPLPGLFPFPVFFELRNTFGCFRNAFSVFSSMVKGFDLTENDVEESAGVAAPTNPSHFSNTYEPNKISNKTQTT